MRRVMLVIGLLIIVAGAYVLNQGTQVLTPLAQFAGLVSQGVSVTPIVPSILVSVPASNYTYLTANLRENVRTNGLLQVEGGSEIGFYVMNEGNFSEWRLGHSSVIDFGEPDANNLNFTFVPNLSGVYYFVFSNQDPNHKHVIFSLRTVENTVIPIPLIQYADLEMLIVGVLLTVVAVKTGKKKPSKYRVEDEHAVKCKYCGTRLTDGETFCQKCGRSQG